MVLIAPPAEEGDRTWIATWLIALLGLTAATGDQALFSYALSEIAAAFGVGLPAMGLLVSASFALAVLCVPLSGMMTDRFGRRRVFVVLLVASALCVGLHSIAQEFWQLAVLRILGFAISGGLYPVCTTLVLESAPNRLRGIASGSLQIAYPLGFFGASIFAAPLLEQGGWRTQFLLAFAVVPLALVLGVLLREPAAYAKLRDAGEAAENEGLRSLVRQPLLRTTVICLLGTFLLNLGISAIIYFVPAYMTEMRGFSAAEAARISGYAFGLGAIGYILSAATGEFLLTRRVTLVLWCILGAASFLGAIWFAESRVALIVGLGLAITFMFGSEAVRMPLIGELYPTFIRTTGLAIGGSAGVSLGSMVGPLIITSLQPAIGWNVAMTTVAGLPLVLGALVFLLLREPSDENFEVPAVGAARATA